MILNLSSAQGKPLHFLQGLPGGYKGKRLPGGHALTCTEDFGTLIIQEFKSDLYSLSYQHFNLLKPVSLHWKASEQQASSCFAIKNDLHKLITGVGPVKIREGQINFQGASADEGSITYEQGKLYESLYTGFSPELLNEFGGKKLPGQQWTGKTLLQWLDDIFTDELHPDFRKLYYENKVKEYLLLGYGRTGKRYSRQEELRTHEKAAVYETLQIISKDMKVHIPIEEIAKKLGLKNFHLKNIFLRSVGMNIYEYQLFQKMKEARRLLLETDYGEKEIASILGYSSLSSFVTAFSKYFNARPSDLRHDAKDNTAE